MDACIHGSNCSRSHMKRRYSFAAFGNFEYLKSIACVTCMNSVRRPTGPIGHAPWPMSAAISFSFGSGEVLAA